MAEKQDEMGSIFSFIKGQVDKLPISQSKKTKMLDQLLKLKTMTVDAREPRIALVGRRGSGKSSLINAMFGQERQYVSSVKSGTGKGKWLWYPSDAEPKIRLLDSRGLGESEAPTEEFEEDTPLDELIKAVTEEQPDVFLFLIKAKEADSRIEEDLQELNKLRKIVKENHHYDVPVICVVTQVDELDPPHYKQVPFDANPKKKKNIDEAIVLMSKRFKDSEIPLLNIIPTCSYIDFDESGNIEYDMRWNIDLLSDYLIEALPSEAKLKTAKAMQSQFVKKKFARTIVGTFTAIAGLIGAEPIPFADFPILTGIQGLMIVVIGFIADKEINTKTASEFIAALGINVGIGLLVREGVRAAVRFIPGAGLVVSGAVAGAVTYGIGQAAIAYFLENKNIDQAKEAYKNANKEYKNEDIDS
ncbi:GTPase family protein [Peribacillus castrilensis]|uniref:GTP-binding protein HSR1-like protein n=1 Tax=Peribacillus simplex TaxID=1478 RepID=A0AAN2PHW2_9BACI|nr:MULTISPECIES: GTPase [Bacillaceae]MCP1095441.1 50S ribosome-binding GTPase [Bacillaceae bacterium OS4b]MBD8591115.1 50S ribosome-binding GTPase [Peribacillus simplex]MCF7622596.1 50S ribosome-binding GTPase [Peribacillus frigoritolerans]MCP1153140.1 50S ribosome-binding GTPase [Peribacillus frigoritolerans]MCT1390203.1 50S ribosome-binding GTPase [Peribacillus frigoritolerans]